MKRFSRYVCMLLVVAILLSVPVFAQEEATPWSSAYFSSHLEYLYEISTIKFEVWFDVIAKRIMDELGASTIKVQRSANGETGWETMKTYNMADYSQMICENTGSHVGCVTYTGTPGYYYRAKITYYAKEGGGIGYYSAYTSVIQL